MLQKFQKMSLKTDAQDGEDEERGEKTMQTKEAGKRKVVTYNQRFSEVGGLADAEKDLEMLQQIEKNRFTFRNGFKTTTVPFIEIEVEVRGGDTKNNEPGPQRHDKIIRRRKRGTKIAKRLKTENILQILIKTVGLTT